MKKTQWNNNKEFKTKDTQPEVLKLHKEISLSKLKSYAMYCTTEFLILNRK